MGSRRRHRTLEVSLREDGSVLTRAAIISAVRHIDQDGANGLPIRVEQVPAVKRHDEESPGRKGLWTWGFSTSSIQ